MIVVDKKAADEEKLTEIVLESGADDLSDEGESWEILTGPKEFEAVRDAVTKAGIKPEHAEVTMVPSTYQKLEGAQNNAMLRLLDVLEELDDTQNLYSNFDFDGAEVAA